MKILIIAFLRKDNLLKIIENAISNGVKEIYLAIDGARNEKEHEMQKQMIEKVEELRIHGNKINMWKRDTNLGIAVSVITAIDWFFKYEEEGLIIEDDLILSDSFYKFSAEMLKKFKLNKNILMFSGNRFSIQTDKLSVAFCNYPQIWGWGTWKDKWLLMRELILANHKLAPLDILDVRKKFLYFGAKRTVNSLIDTWDLPLAYEFLKGDYLCVIPPLNIVSNIGNDNFSVHTKSDHFPMNFPINNFDVSKLEFAEISRKTISNENRFIEKNIFNIRWHHHFLPFYGPINSLIKKLSNKLYEHNLLERLNGVRLP